ncbi:DUF1559 domain-containing protein [bacterium]|nr:DUF1559 domain-containing protein [bacterium]
MRGRTNRTGFTLIELLVVIAIIAILIGLLLPAVQKVREAAARSKCQNNLKQMGLALHNYEGTYGYFPSAGTNYAWVGTPATTTGQNLNGLVQLLPYIEQQALFTQYDNKSASQALVKNGHTLLGGAVGATNIALSTQRVSTFRCPSDNGKETLNVGDANYGQPGVEAIKTNYDFMAYPTSGANYWKNASSITKYMFGENSNSRVAHVTDGTSNTFAMAEGTLDVYDGSRAAWAYRGWVMTGLDPKDGINVNVYPSWVSGGLAGTPLPNKNQASEWWNPGSLHTGGANFLMGDGAVVFIRNGVDTTTLRNLTAMGDGNVAQLP